MAATPEPETFASEVVLCSKQDGEPGAESSNVERPYSIVLILRPLELSFTLPAMVEDDGSDGVGGGGSGEETEAVAPSDAETARKSPVATLSKNILRTDW